MDQSDFKARNEGVWKSPKIDLFGTAIVYGVPTRLMDWSTDILITLFFACSDETKADKDGALFICNHNDYPVFSAYDKQLMDSQKLSFINTSVVNPRMRAQSGCFMMWGHSPLDENSTESYDLSEYSDKHENTYYLNKICFPKDAKGKILNELRNIYSITLKNLYMQHGYLEKTFGPNFIKLREDAGLYTLYATDADRLTDMEQKKARLLKPYDYRNMLGGCVRLSNFK